MIKIIAFDFGDVLVKDTLKAIGKKYWTSKVPRAKKTALLNANNKVNIGKASEQLLVDALKDSLVPHWSKEKIRKYLFTSKLLPPWKIMLKLKKHYPIAILTNNFRNGPETFTKLLNVSIRGCQIVNSAKIGVRKPHAKFYDIALKKLKVKPSEIVFIDDRPRNVAGARKAGIKAFCYNKNMPQLRAFLRKNGVKEA